MTSKGQFTMPAAFRKKLGLDKKGAKAEVVYDESHDRLYISRTRDIEELSARISSFIKPGTKPVLNVDDFYQRHRQADHG